VKLVKLSQKAILKVLLEGIFMIQWIYLNMILYYYVYTMEIYVLDILFLVFMSIINL